MELFNEYYNSEMLFLFDLFSLNRPFTANEAIEYVKAAHVYAPYNYMDVLDKWIKNGLIEKTENGKYCISHDPKLYTFVPPLNTLEMEYLSDICHTKEAHLFSLKDMQNILPITDTSIYDCILRQNTIGKQEGVNLVNTAVFLTVIKAIYEHRRINYDYCTNSDPTIRSSDSIPFRLEYSVFDGRWWLISYSETQTRTIKSKLQNVKAVRLKEKHTISDEVIRNAIMRHLVEQPVVLRIDNKKNALERCFLVFEDMLDMTAFHLGDEKYELQFRYFDWDRNVIVRKLLYLGENVVLKSPSEIKQEVISELKTALSSNR